MNETQQQLHDTFPDFDWKFDLPLAQQTYFKIGGPAEAFVELSAIEAIQKLVQFCHQKKIALTLLGGASNVIIADQGIAGVVLRVTSNTFETKKNNQGTIVLAGGGLKTALFVRKTIDAGLMGLEYFLGVPGNLSGAIFNNAHYLQQLMAEHIIRVRVLTQSGELVWLEKTDCDFAYDQSRFQTSKEIILEAEFLLPDGTAEESQKIIAEATRYRASTQPLGIPSSGCIFQNVLNTPELKQQFPQFKHKTHIGAGFLIDQAGLKGTKIGDIEISQKHAAFFINTGQGSAQDVTKLIQLAKTRVREVFGVKLQEEVFLLG